MKALWLLEPQKLNVLNEIYLFIKNISAYGIATYNANISN